MLDTRELDAEIAILEAELNASRVGGQSTLLRDTEELDAAVQSAQLAVAREQAGLQKCSGRAQSVDRRT